MPTRKCCNTPKGQSPHATTCHHAGQVPPYVHTRESKADPVEMGRPNWDFKCTVCGATPVVSGIGLCGPCCFGEAATMNGHW